jgi:hypothetical protein
MARAKRIDGRWLREWRERLGYDMPGAMKALGFKHRMSIVKLESGQRAIDTRLALACMMLEALRQPGAFSAPPTPPIGLAKDGVLLDWRPR